MRRLPDTITEKELKELLKETIDKNHKIAFALAFYNCLRISEVVNLKKEHIDFDRRVLYIKQGKGKKDRHIPIAPQVYRGLKYIPVGIGIRALQIAFKRKAKRILNKDLHFHCLRHSGATHYLNVKGWNLRQLQVFLGHSRLDTTAIYTHINPVDLVEKMWN